MKPRDHYRVHKSHTTQYHTNLRSISVLPSHLRLDLQSSRFLSVFATKTLQKQRMLMSQKSAWIWTDTRKQNYSYFDVHSVTAALTDSTTKYLLRDEWENDNELGWTRVVANFDTKSQLRHQRTGDEGGGEAQGGKFPIRYLNRVPLCYP
jgi:hypothetical protein